MESLIKNLEKKALNSDEILKYLEGKPKLVTYPELAKMKHIDEALGRNGMCVLLYLTKHNFGHWCCFYKNDPNTITFFDSYGKVIDSQLKHIPEHFRRESNQKKSHLCRLLYESGYDVHYNDHPLQRLQKGINTCGRHVICRLMLKSLGCDEYANLFKGKDADAIVSLLTEDIK